MNVPRMLPSWASRGFAAACLVLAAACGEDDAPTLPTGPAVVSFTASSMTVPAGESVQLAWRTERTEQVRIVAEPGGELAGAAEPVGALRTGALEERTTFTLEATGGGQTARATLTVEADASGAPPAITRLEASPNPVDFGASITLTWAAVRADRVVIRFDGTSVVDVQGQAMGTLTRTIDAVEGVLVAMEATNAAGTTRRSLPIEVIAPPGVEVEPNDGPMTATRLDAMGLATASLEPAGDVDYFVVTVAEGGWIRAETSDGRGGCAVDQVMELRGPTDNVLATGRVANLVLDASGQAIGACRRIDPRLDAGARGLRAGTYYVRVTSGTFQPRTGAYTLVVTTGPSGCGNGIIETGEQCDDANQAEDDGCSATCMASAAATLSSGDPARTNLSAGLPMGGSSLLRVVATRAGTLVAEVGSPRLGECDAPMRLVVLDERLAPIGSAEQIQINQNSVFPCGRIDPDRQAALSAIPAAGTYWLRVEPIDAQQPIARFEVTARLYDNGCGNGYREAMEPCDDGNRVDGDRCSNACALNTLQVESAAVPVFVGTRFDPFERIRVQLSARGSVTASVTAPAGSTQRSCGVPTRMGLSVAATNVQALGLSATGVTCGGVVHPEASFAADLTAGSYDLLILNGGSGGGGDVLVRTGFVAPRCGNGIAEPGWREACDDGDTVDTNGCRNNCTLNQVLRMEAEPNDLFEEADELVAARGGAVATASGRLSAASDVDTYVVDLPAGPNLSLVTYTSADDARACSTIDTVVTVFDEARNIVAENDDRSDLLGNLCSRLLSSTSPALQNLPAGRYYVTVRAYPQSTPGPYFLDLEVR